MVWMKGDLRVDINDLGAITVTVHALHTMEGTRPRSFAESGTSEEAARAIRERTPGTYETTGFMGGATAIVVPFRSLSWLEDRWMDRLRAKFHIEQWPDDVLVMLYRNTGAPAIQNAAEPAGGMAEDVNLAVEQLKEIVEVGVYRDDGWVRFRLPEHLAAHQEAFDQEQRDWWRVVAPSLEPTSEARLEFLAKGHDIIDDQVNGDCRDGVWTAGPVGDISFLSLAKLYPDGTGWRLRDTECRPGNRDAGETALVALDRTVVVVVPRPDRSPIMLHVGPDGVLHPCGIHVALSCEALEYNLTHLGRAAIEALG